LKLFSEVYSAQLVQMSS